MPNAYGLHTSSSATRFPPPAPPGPRSARRAFAPLAWHHRPQSAKRKPCTPIRGPASHSRYRYRYRYRAQKLEMCAGRLLRPVTRTTRMGGGWGERPRARNACARRWRKTPAPDRMQMRGGWGSDREPEMRARGDGGKLRRPMRCRCGEGGGAGWDALHEQELVMVSRTPAFLHRRISVPSGVSLRARSSLPSPIRALLSRASP
jgi:hypothetical protein